MRRWWRLGAATAVLLILFSSGTHAFALAGPNPAVLKSVFIAKELTGLTWDGSEFIATNGTTNVPLVKVSLDGKTVAPFAPSFVGKDEVYIAISQGQAGFPAGYLYVNSDPSIYQISPNGSSVRLFSSPPGASRIAYVAFDTVGTWGNLLFAVDDNGLLWSIKSDGTAAVLDNFTTDFGKGLKPEGIAVAPQSFGAYGGDLIVTLEGVGRVLAIPPGDPSVWTTIATLPGQAPERVLTIPPQSDLYLAGFDTGNMSMVPAANFTSYADAMLVVTEGETEKLGTFNVLQASGGQVSLTEIGAVDFRPHFEGAAWVPANELSTASATASGSEVGQISIGTLVGGLGLLGVAVVLAFYFAFWRRRRLSGNAVVGQR